MARQGISEQQVNEAAEQLAQQGQAVTVSAVREALGTGSYSTVSGFLAKWKESGDGRKPEGAPDMPEGVARAMRQLWAAAWKEAQDGIKAEREALEGARRDMEREKRDMAGEIARLEAENAGQGETIARLTEDLDIASGRLAAAEQAVNALKIDNARLDERAKAAEGRAQELRGEVEKLLAFRASAAPQEPAKPARQPRGRKPSAGDPQQ